ncbi:MAG: hypothetical protein JAY74_19625 [Candidatus Thiodiazotropha taylori]|nr:hypothetical protein [Candidatus Thiodiazotropha taylori]
MKTGVSIEGIREDVFNLIHKLLEERRDALGYWKRFHFIDAISALAWNLNSKSNPPIGLHLSLVSLGNILIHRNESNRDYARKDELIESLTHEQVAKALRDVIANH